MRLDRLLAGRGYGSRKDVGARIRRGHVTVDGEVVRDPGASVADGAVVAVEGAVAAAPPALISWHKPVGVLSTLRDPWGREGVDHVLPEAWRGWLHPVGRLDQDTSGLLLFSADGALTQHLLHPRRAVPRTYLATVDQVPPGLAGVIAAGVETADGRVSGEVEAIDGCVVRLTVREGRHRMVRRMLHNAGASVLALRRLSYGTVSLGDLAPGALRVEDDGAVAALWGLGAR